MMMNPMMMGMGGMMNGMGMGIGMNPMMQKMMQDQMKFMQQVTGGASSAETPGQESGTAIHRPFKARKLQIEDAPHPSGSGGSADAFWAGGGGTGGAEKPSPLTLTDAPKDIAGGAESPADDAEAPADDAAAPADGAAPLRLTPQTQALAVAAAMQQMKGKKGAKGKAAQAAKKPASASFETRKAEGEAKNATCKAALDKFLATKPKKIPSKAQRKTLMPGGCPKCRFASPCPDSCWKYRLGLK